MNGLVVGLLQVVFNLYANLQRNVNQSLVGVSKCLKKMFDREVMAYSMKIGTLFAVLPELCIGPSSMFLSS